MRRILGRLTAAVLKPFTAIVKRLIRARIGGRRMRGSYKIVRAGRPTRVKPQDHEDLLALREELEYLRLCGQGDSAHALTLLCRSKAFDDVDTADYLRDCLIDARAPQQALALEAMDADHPQLGDELDRDKIAAKARRFHVKVAEQLAAANLDFAESVASQYAQSVGLDLAKLVTDTDGQNMSDSKPTDETTDPAGTAENEVEASISDESTEVGDIVESDAVSDTATDATIDNTADGDSVDEALASVEDDITALNDLVEDAEAIAQQALSDDSEVEAGEAGGNEAVAPIEEKTSDEATADLNDLADALMDEAEQATGEVETDIETSTAAASTDTSDAIDATVTEQQSTATPDTIESNVENVEATAMPDVSQATSEVVTGAATVAAAPSESTSPDSKHVTSATAPTQPQTAAPAAPPPPLDAGHPPVADRSVRSGQRLRPDRLQNAISDMGEFLLDEVAGLWNQARASIEHINHLRTQIEQVHRHIHDAHQQMLQKRDEAADASEQARRMLDQIDNIRQDMVRTRKRVDDCATDAQEAADRAASASREAQTYARQASSSTR